MICIITHDTLKTGLKTETLKNCLLFSSGGIPHFLEEKKKTQTIDIKKGLQSNNALPSENHSNPHSESCSAFYPKVLKFNQLRHYTQL